MLQWTIQIGLCTPLSCTQAELAPLIRDYIHQKFLHAQKLFNLHLRFNKLRFVQTNNTWLFFTPSCVFLIGLASILVILAIAGCYYDEEEVITKENNNVAVKTEKSYMRKL